MKIEWREIGQVKKEMFVDEKWSDHSVKGNQLYLWKFAFL